MPSDAVLAALAVARLALAHLEFEAKATAPAPGPPDDSAAIRRTLRQFFRRQVAAVLARLPRDPLAATPADLSVTDWTDAMTSAMTPVLRPVWDAAGAAVMADLGLDPAAWRVVSPALAPLIERQSFHFCAETNRTTSLALADAHQALRDALTQGLVAEGRTLDWFVGRVRDVFHDATEVRARTIAETEAARAQNLASLESARRSGVVASKRLLLSSDACAICHRVKATEPPGGWPLDATMHDDGRGHEYYSQSPCPPLHPRCRCSITYVLTPEYDPARVVEQPRPPEPIEVPKQPPAPEPTPAERLLAGRKARVDARMAELVPRQEAAAAAVRAARAEYDRLLAGEGYNPGRPAARDAYYAAQRQLRAIEGEYNRLAAWEDLAKEVPGLVPAGPIADRIKDYAAAEGDALIAQLKERLASIATHREEYERLAKEIGSVGDRKMAAQDAMYVASSARDMEAARAHRKEADRLDARLQELASRRFALRDILNGSQGDSRAVVAEVLAVDRPAEIRLAPLPFGTTIEGRQVGAQPASTLYSPDDATRAAADRASSWLSRITHAGDAGPIERRIGMAAGQRAYHVADHVAVDIGESSDVIVHELGHAIDGSIGLANEDVLRRSLEFLAHRTAGEAAVRMADVPGVRPGAYGPDERGRGDDFGKVFDARPGQAHYVGSDYGDRGTEVLSMGVQMLYNDPAKLINNDPEYSNFLIGVLRGPLR